MTSSMASTSGMSAAAGRVGSPSTRQTRGLSVAAIPIAGAEVLALDELQVGAVGHQKLTARETQLAGQGGTGVRGVGPDVDRTGERTRAQPEEMLRDVVQQHTDVGRSGDAAAGPPCGAPGCLGDHGAPGPLRVLVAQAGGVVARPGRPGVGHRPHPPCPPRPPEALAQRAQGSLEGRPLHRPSLRRELEGDGGRGVRPPPQPTSWSAWSSTPAQDLATPLSAPTVRPPRPGRRLPRTATRARDARLPRRRAPLRRV